MGRTNIEIDDDLINAVMMRFSLATKREAVDYALRHLAGQPASIEEIIASAGSIPDFEVPEDPTDFVAWSDEE